MWQKWWMNNDTTSCLKEQANKNGYTSMGTPSLGRLHRRPYLSYLNVHLHLHKKVQSRINWRLFQ